MFSFLKKSNANPTFVIDFPQIAISPDTHTFIDLRKASTIEQVIINQWLRHFALVLTQKQFAQCAFL